MAWTTPLTAVANATLTAAQWNASVRDNLNETAVAKATTAGSIFAATGSNAIAERIPDADWVFTSESTTSTSYTDLATVGPNVTVTTGVQALLIFSSRIANTTADSVSMVDYDISGATTRGASDSTSLRHNSAVSGASMRASSVDLRQSLTSGSNTFTLKYKVISGSGAFQDRRVAVMPL